MMLALLAATLLSQNEDLPWPPDPFDHNTPPVCVNDADTKASSEPSFLVVGFAIGSREPDQCPVVIAKRICLNNAAATLLDDEIRADKQQIKADARIIDSIKAVSNEQEDTIKKLSIFSFLSIIFFAGMALWALRKN